MSKKQKGEFYISIDMESFGPCPGLHSMVQFAAVFYTDSGILLNSFTRNIEELSDTTRDPDTMQWWEKQEIEFPGIMERLMQDRVSAASAMNDFTALVRTTEKVTGCRPVVVAYPAGFDFSFLYYYLHRFTGGSCVGFSALDMKTFSMTLLPDKGYRGFGRKDMPKNWFDPCLSHTHTALDDALEQGHLFFSMLRAIKELTETFREGDSCEQGDHCASTEMVSP